MSSLRRRSIPARGRWCALASLAIAFALGAGAPASASVQVAPWAGNIGFVSSESKAGGVTDLQTSSPTGPEPWSAAMLSQAHNDTTNASAFAYMTFATSFKDSIFAVSSSGFGSVDGPAASNTGGVFIYVLFVVDRTQNYITYPTFASGSFGSRITFAFIANLMSPSLEMLTLMPSQPISSGRLAPGFYAYFYTSHYKDEAINGNADGASSQIAFFDVPNPLITQHPQSQTVPVGGSASFSGRHERARHRERARPAQHRERFCPTQR